jgi:hypothetical protein
MKSERVYFHYELLEEFQEGMWRIVRGDERKMAIERAARLMKSPDEFKAAMSKALERWPNSCAHNFTCDGMNKIAWLGHAGCCIGAGSPEEATRTAWYHLSDDEMARANAVAAEVLAEYRISKQLDLPL